MAEEYDHITATHYAAYRPPLHQIILEKADLPAQPALGLDIGCGTGQSSIALAGFCRRVIGLEPSAAMRAQAITHAGVQYQDFKVPKLYFADQSVDVVAFAGSLFYCKSQELLDEIIRVLKPGGQVLVYDFEVDLHTWFQELELVPPITDTPYNHEEDLNGLQIAPLILQKKVTSSVVFPINNRELAHLLLSLQWVHQKLAKRYHTSSPLEQLAAKLETVTAKTAKAALFLTTYST